MNERFFALPEAKRNAIVNAGFRVFARYGYKKASTDEIAREAGISKALLFHYFGSKREYYLYLYNYAIEFLVKALKSMTDRTETDFFKICFNAQMAKMKLLAEHPDAMQFALYAYLEGDEEVKGEADASFGIALEASAQTLITRSNAAMFKEGVQVEKVLDIVLWMSEGYMLSRTPEQLADLEAVNDEFLDYLELLKRHFYREEYL
ncbi:TetR/AcrR family transcriptional regulator [Raoultibacter phocaeensis]|uniref:TetR/AcrR family transcriptional regulator n=1 Tax=Raoultibacter phocaeensis TaxID=2479841 RepID=UPI00111ADB55|nr:TetR/AcrR family transcriptional regulator [Raoultibacter phocaeensis]